MLNIGTLQLSIQLIQFNKYLKFKCIEMVSLKNHLHEETAKKATVMLATLNIYRH